MVVVVLVSPMKDVAVSLTCEEDVRTSVSTEYTVVVSAGAVTKLTVVAIVVVVRKIVLHGPMVAA